MSDTITFSVGWLWPLCCCVGVTLIHVWYDMLLPLLDRVRRWVAR